MRTMFIGVITTGRVTDNPYVTTMFAIYTDDAQKVLPKLKEEIVAEVHGIDIAPTTLAENPFNLAPHTFRQL